ncbi:F-box/RNI/FBD-like domain protein [Medicago truncatula]|uniref:F-box/RNI/FBD-like domain protein n=1 Tax=Medicago truncatula TaxID=3880 RepID=G7K8R7_MEDTR|nr:F-box/RNI/FBD-like domain protein [Medicago truncatula]
MKKTAFVDRISNLPDELLSNILSFLPTKQDFSTSLLSKTWAPLCHSLSVLEFDDETNRDDDDECRPRIYDVNLQKSLHAWVEAAKQRYVEEFNLIAHYTRLNPIIFTSQTLFVLKLEWLHVENYNFYVDLPSLKILGLKYVCCENQNDFIKLLNACPILQDLHIFYPRYSRLLKYDAHF